MQVNQATGVGEPPDSANRQYVAGVRGAPHLEPLPDRSPFLDPGCQITCRGACNGYFVPITNGSLDEVPDADSHAVHRRLRDDQDATGSWWRGHLLTEFYSLDFLNEEWQYPMAAGCVVGSLLHP